MIIRVIAQIENITYYFYLILKKEKFALVWRKKKKHRGPLRGQGGGEKAVEKNHTHRMEGFDLAVPVRTANSFCNVCLGRDTSTWCTEHLCQIILKSFNA
jgi:hypothetical protein